MIQGPDTMVRTTVVAACFGLMLLARVHAAAPAADLTRFNAQVKPLLESHCVDCHGAKTQKGKFRVDMLNPDLFVGNDGEHWQDLLDQLNGGDMPPKDAKAQLSRAQRETITGWLQSELRAAADVRSGADGRTMIRRLTRYEINYSLQDLLKVGLDFTKNMPDDRAGSDGLRNNAALLGMTPMQFEQIADIAENAVRKALVAPEKPQSIKHRDEAEAKNNSTRGRPAGEVVSNGVQLAPGHELSINVPEIPHEGRFRIRARVGGTAGEDGEVPRLQVWMGFRATGTSFIRQTLAEVPVMAPRDKPEVLTFEGYIENFPVRFETGEGETPAPGKKKGAKKVGKGELIGLVAVDEGHEPAEGEQVQVKGKKQDKDAKQERKAASSKAGHLFVDWVEFEGPYFESWPPASRVACIGSESSASVETRASTALQSFAARAWRRPVAAAEVKPFMAAFNRVYAAKHSFDDAIAEALALIIASPDFLYLVEPAGDQSRTLNAHELAARISYFLWSSVPDDTLRKAADSGKLLDKAALAEQVRRMIADPKTHRLAEHFSEQWLGTDQIHSVAVNPEYYPKFRDHTKESLASEPAEFFWHVLEQKKSVLDFLDSKYVVVDEMLARHYGLKGVEGPEFRAVPVKPEDHRGGLLGMGGFMLAQSDGSHSHAIFRGKWVLTNVLCTPPPPPPPNVPQLDQASPDFAKLPLKQQLAIHRKKEACASCHDKLDPYGLALENFDAVGKWRTEDLRLIAEREEPANKKKKAAAAPPKFERVPVDSTVSLADGTPLKGFDDLKAYLLRTKQDAFAEGLVRKMLAYALGRSLVWSDQPEVARLKQRFSASEYKLDALISEILFSKPFQTK